MNAAEVLATLVLPVLLALATVRRIIQLVDRMNGGHR